MNRSRRLFAVVLVALAVAVLASTVALSSVSGDRTTEVSVASDATAYLALEDGHPAGGLVRQTGEGTLAIDFTYGGGAGANAASQYVLGSTQTPIGNHAFAVHNRGTMPVNLTLRYDLASGGQSGGPESVRFDLFVDRGGDGSIDGTETLTENTGTNTATVAGLAPGESVYVVLVVDTAGLGPGSDLGGELVVDADGVPTP
jgi:hypothetical protein